jgi:hypothetical protein
LTFGIYLDNRTSNNLIYGNVIVGVAFGIMIKGYNNIVENNILIDAGISHIWISAHASYKDHTTVVARNIFYDRASNQLPFFRLPNRQPLYRSLLYCDENVYCKQEEANPVMAKGEPPQFQEEDEQSMLPEAGTRLADWPPASWSLEKVYDRRSVFADPLFIDAEHGNYGLAANSPALALGFQPINLASIGRR